MSSHRTRAYPRPLPENLGNGSALLCREDAEALRDWLTATLASPPSEKSDDDEASAAKK